MSVRVHRMELITRSPVMVSAGRHAVLSPYVDVVQEGDLLHYIDPRRMETALAEASPDAIDELVRSVRTGMTGKGSPFNLRRFLLERLHRRPAEVASRSVPVSGSINHAQIRRHHADAGRPIIPGSTLKGAFRGAIFLDWLLVHAEGKRRVARLCEEVERLWKQHGAAIDRAEAHFRTGDIAAGRWIVEPLLPVAREALDPFQPAALFGRIEDRDARGRPVPSDLRLLRVSDTSHLDPARLRVERVSRVRLRDAAVVSPQWSEVIPAGERLTFTITIEPRFRIPALADLNGDSLPALLRRVAHVSERVLEFEMDVLDELEDQTALTGVYNALERLESDPVPGGGVRMRVGGGKTYFDNSLGLAVRQHDAGTFEHFRRLLGLGRNPKHKAFSSHAFPATRAYVRRKNDFVQPLGWVDIRPA